MTNAQRDKYNQMYDELLQLSHKLEKFYDIDRIKEYGIYVWNIHPSGFGTNIFDIYADEIRIWEPCSIHSDSLPIISEIIRHLQKMEEFRKECKDEL